MFLESPLLLIDADSIYFRVAYRTKKKNEIRKGIDDMVKDIMNQCQSDDVIVAVKGRDNFRNAIYPKYKANRKALEPDMKTALNYGHGYMIGKYNAVVADGMEADDLVSIWAAEARAVERDYVVVGIDKDLLQIPGKHYNFNKRTHQVITTDMADLCLMLQCLTGDSTDNIPGLKGIGPAKAKKILDGVPMERRWGRVKAAWRAHKTNNPSLSRALLQMLTSFEETEVVRDLFKSKTTLRQPDVLEGKESKDESISSVPE